VFKDVAGDEWQDLAITLQTTAQQIDDLPTAASITTAVWAAGARTLTSYGTLVADITTAIWAAGARTLTSFGTLVADTVDAVWDELIAGHLNVGSTGEALNDNGTPAIIADAVWDEAIADHVAAGSTGETLNDTCCSLGSGATLHTYTVTDSATGLPLQGVVVQVSTDTGLLNIVATDTTDASGEILFYLDPGTYYMWSFKAGYTFTNPDTEVVV